MLGAGVVAAVTIGCLPGTPPAAALPTWSPAGDRIAYTVPAQETASIEIARPGTLGPVEGAVSYDSAPTQLSWSPAGERIAFEKRTGAISVLGLGRFGGGIRELVHVETGTVTELGDWSPDGRQLVFARDGHIHVLDVESGEIRYLAEGDHPTWSHDGLEIAYAVGDAPAARLQRAFPRRLPRRSARRVRPRDRQPPGRTARRRRGRSPRRAAARVPRHTARRRRARLTAERRHPCERRRLRPRHLRARDRRR